MMKRLLISAASLTLALAFMPAYGSSHGHDEGMDSMDKDGAALEEQRKEAMDRGTEQGIDVEDLPPTAAGDESEGSIDDELFDGPGIPPDETDPEDLSQEESDSEY
ncbi:hypothetical protein LPB19_08510 [Marinobacter salinisoli]|uniref:Uncharacterized protein n=1 Tax=Marinobacter salinisoli TaxID=2769486 RepID=A0ABX7MW69_9GAMM|nr:hypothetical protein [Marinobacter salinisoli]QSP96398.1 hypothetical protein LPB19_08510 [Marinobacter salinisoli]